MSLLTVVQDVCAAVGVERPDAVIPGINSNRTMQEMLALANEMAQRIAYDTKDWTLFSIMGTLHGDTANSVSPQESAHVLPAIFKRFLLTSNIWRSTSTIYPMRFIPDEDMWVQHRLRGYADQRGEWIKLGNVIHIAPPLAVSQPAAVPPKLEQTATFVYLHKNCIQPFSDPLGTTDVFQNDGDIYPLSERVLKLGMIWQWKALKGSPYAEDMNNYNDALDRVSGADKPAPIIIGRQTMSAAVNQSYPFPIDPSLVPL
jgi:hypothetical protein